MSQDQKRETIIEAALKRFAHFGVAKTTMNEIAGDLAISKASLYYYFPDKINLYAEVLKSISESDTRNDAALVDNEPDPWKAVALFLEKRTDFIIKYHHILEYLKTYTPMNMPPELESLFTHFREQEVGRVTAILQRSKEQGLFRIEDARKTAELFYDFLEGFRYATLSRSGMLFPDKKQFLAILKKEKEFTRIFFNGLAFNNP
jgi:TetR/AcrR family transcriptional repressor of mexJK operon